MAVKKILVVDDEPQLLDMIKMRLEASGYEVVCAADGQEALDYVSRYSPDLVILDLMLPKIDGYKVCGLLKQDTRYKNIPVIMLTALTEEKDNKLSKQVYADGYLNKPFDPKVLLAEIKRLS